MDSIKLSMTDLTSQAMGVSMKYLKSIGTMR